VADRYKLVASELAMSPHANWGAHASIYVAPEVFADDPEGITKAAESVCKDAAKHLVKEYGPRRTLGDVWAEGMAKTLTANHTQEK